MIIKNKTIIMLILLFGVITSVSSQNNFKIKRDTLNNRKIIETHIYTDSFFVEYDTLFRIDKLFNDTIITGNGLHLYFKEGSDKNYILDLFFFTNRMRQGFFYADKLTITY